jgi:hypothetical protein
MGTEEFIVNTLTETHIPKRAWNYQFLMEEPVPGVDFACTHTHMHTHTHTCARAHKIKLFS